MKSRKVIILAGIIVVLTVVFAAVHLTTRKEVPEHTVLVSAKEDTYLVDIMKLKYEKVTGIRVNGKGEEKKVEGEGIAMKDFLAELQLEGYEKISVAAEDSYSAEVTAEEIEEDGKVYLLLEDDRLRLIVFGDKNSKRNVLNVTEIILSESRKDVKMR